MLAIILLFKRQAGMGTGPTTCLTMVHPPLETLGWTRELVRIDDEIQVLYPLCTEGGLCLKI